MENLKALQPNYLLDTEFENPNSITPLHGAALEAMEAVKEVALNTHPNIVPQVNIFLEPALFSLLLEKIILNLL